MGSDKVLVQAENRFKRTANIKQDISSFPLSEEINNVTLNKEKSKEFGEVFTPLWLVDQMISQVNWKSSNMQTLDLCAGYGQFSVRLMRYFHNTYSDFSLAKFLKENHAFSELQLSSCYKLINSFSNLITLYIGDSTYLNKLPTNARGLWCYIEKYGYWVCLTQTISKLVFPNGVKEKPCSEEKFVKSMEALIYNLNQIYTKIKDMQDQSLQQITSSSVLRLELIKTINDSTASTCIQNVFTPVSVIDDMLECVDNIEKKSILVLFNCEIVERLIHKKKVDPKNILFGVDFNGSLKAIAMEKMYGVETTLVDSKLLFLHSAFKGRKFDVCLSNPPYNRGLDLKILTSLMGNGTIAGSIAKEYVIVHPSTWLLDQKDKTNLYGNVKRMIANRLPSIKFFNGNAVFDAELFVPCIITHIDLNYDSSKTRVKFFDEEFEVSSVSDITKFGEAWLTLVKPFVATIEKAIQKSSQVWAHNTRTIDTNKFYCQAAAIRGDVKDRGKKKSIVNSAREITQDNFYTMLIDVQSCKGIRQPNLNRPGNPTPTFGFDTEVERDNFLHYLNTDFARFCLAILKNNGNLAVGEMELIPWLDFTQAWDDEKLFKHFNINQEMQEYIRKFLPDYYGIRKISTISVSDQALQAAV